MKINFCYYFLYTVILLCPLTSLRSEHSQNLKKSFKEQFEERKKKNKTNDCKDKDDFCWSQFETTESCNKKLEEQRQLEEKIFILVSILVIPLLAYIFWKILLYVLYKILFTACKAISDGFKN